MTFTHRPVDPAADLDLLYSWLSQPRAKFWGMTEHSREKIGETYAFIDSLESHHANLLFDDGEPVALFQTYQPEHDPIGESYDVQPGDLGGHLFLAPTDEPRSGFSTEVILFLLDWAFSDPEVVRIIGEPDILNTKSVDRASQFATAQGQIDLAEKKAELFTLHRSEWEVLRPGLGADSADD